MKRKRKLVWRHRVTASSMQPIGKTHLFEDRGNLVEVFPAICGVDSAAWEEYHQGKVRDDFKGCPADICHRCKAASD